MTFLNSMIAVETLAKELFPGRDCSVNRVGYSLVFGNFVLCWFGGLPSCHGKSEIRRLLRLLVFAMI